MTKSIITRYIEFVVVTIFFSALAVLFFLRAIIAGNGLLPSDILLQYDPVFKVEDVHSYNNLSTDIILQFLPYRAFLSANKGFSYWNPNALGGLPFFEDIQARSLEITNLFGNLFKIPLQYFFQFSALILLVFAGISMYFFVKELKLSSSSAVLSSIAFTFSNPIIIWISYTLGTTFIWLPFLFLCVEKVKNRKKVFLPLFSLAICFQLFAGHPQAALLNILCVVAYICYCSYPFSAKKVKQNVIIILFLLLGVSLSAIQTIPAFNFIRSSEVFDIGRSLKVEKATNLEVFIQKSALLFAPNFYGNPVARDYHYPNDPLYNNYYELARYVGLITLFFALVGMVVLVKRKKDYFWCVAPFAAFLLSLNLPMLYCVAQLPIVDKINLGRLIFASVFFIAVLAAYGFDIFEEKIKKLVYKIFIPFVIMAGLIALVFFDLFIHTSFLKNNNSVPIKELEQSNIVDFLNQSAYRFIGISENKGGIHTPLIPNLAMLFGLYDLRGYFVMQPKYFLQLSQRYLSRRGNYFFEDDIFSDKFLDLYSVKYILCSKNDCERYVDKYNSVLEESNINILENKDALPRAFISYNYRQYNDIQEVFNALEDVDYSFTDGVLVKNIDSHVSEISEIDDVVIISNEPDHITISAIAKDKGILVFTDNYHNGWRVFVNGKQKDVLQVFEALKGVGLEKGKNIVEFIYVPEYFKFSIAITISSLLILIAYLFYGLRKNIINIGCD